MILAIKPAKADLISFAAQNQSLLLDLGARMEPADVGCFAKEVDLVHADFTSENCIYLPITNTQTDDLSNIDSVQRSRQDGSRGKPPDSTRRDNEMITA
jgi:hypothetical protein